MPEPTDPSDPTAVSATPPAPGPCGPYLRRRGRSYQTVEGVRRGLVAVIQAVERNTLDVARARVLIYGLSTLANLIESSDLERRIEALEQAAAGRVQ